MRNVVRGTRLASLTPLFSSNTSLILGRRMVDIGAIVDACPRHMHVLAVVCDDRVLTVAEARRLAEHCADTRTLPAATVALLQHWPGQLQAALAVGGTR